MTMNQKINTLTTNIRNAEDRASRAIVAGNEVAHRLALSLAEACREELNTLKS
jgi:hypothetical protein